MKKKHEELLHLSAYPLSVYIRKDDLVWWNSMIDDIRQVIRECEHCTRRRSGTGVMFDRILLISQGKGANGNL